MSKRSQTSSDEEEDEVDEVVVKRRRHVRFRPVTDANGRASTNKPTDPVFIPRPCQRRSAGNAAPEPETGEAKVFSLTEWKVRAKVTRKYKTMSQIDAEAEEICNLLDEEFSQNNHATERVNSEWDISKEAGDDRTSKKQAQVLADNECFYTLPDSPIDIISGSYHQGDHRFSRCTRGRQCVPNSLMSIVCNYTKHVHLWTRWDLDRILEHGDTLYTSLQASPSICNEYLLVEELPSEIELENKMYILEYSDPLAGLLDTSQENNETRGVAYDLESALLKVYRTSDACLISFGGNTQSIIKHSFVYYMFDPHSRSPKTGLLSSNGSSALVRRKSIGDLTEHLKALARSMRVSRKTQFEITGVTVYTSDE